VTGGAEGFAHGSAITGQDEGVAAHVAGDQDGLVSVARRRL
jgi:hypothetical protein